MILEKANGASLELPIGFQMQVHVANKAIAQAIVKTLVVGEIKSQLLQRPFRIAVGLRDPNEVRQCLGSFVPELLARRSG